jgi:multicomponent Na+:H+ antiporter subunit B
LGLAVSGYFLFNFLPKGIPNSLFSAGILPLLYIAIGFKVGSELTGIIDGMLEESE